MSTELTEQGGSGKLTTCEWCQGELSLVSPPYLCMCPKCGAYYDVRDGRKYFLAKHGNQPVR